MGKILGVASPAMRWAVLLLLAGSPLAAQRYIEAGPLLGYYRPTGSFDPATVYSVSLPARPKDLSGALWGGAARIWSSGRLGAQLQFTATRRDLGVVYTPVGPTDPRSAWVTTATVQGLYRLLGTSRARRVWLSAGPGVVRHAGKSYDRFGAQTDLALAAGLGGSIPVLGRLSATGGAEMMCYAYDVPMPAELRANGASLQKGAQRDALLHVGLTWAWH